MDISTMSLADMYVLRVELNNAITAIEGEAYSSLLSGSDVQGFELKPGRNIRKVKSEADLGLYFEEKGFRRAQLYDAKFKGVPALEKIFKELLEPEEVKHVMSDFIEVNKSNPSLVYVGDTNE